MANLTVGPYKLTRGERGAYYLRRGNGEMYQIWHPKRVGNGRFQPWYVVGPDNRTIATRHSFDDARAALAAHFEVLANPSRTLECGCVVDNNQTLATCPEHSDA